MGWLKQLLTTSAKALEDFLHIVMEPTGQYFWSDAKLWLGLVMWAGIWLYWLSHRESEARYIAVGRYWTTALMVFGLNLATLSLLQTLRSVGFFGLLLLVTFNVRYTQVLFDAKGFDAPASGDTKTVNASNLYEDVLSDFLQITILFIAQSVLVCFVIYSSFVKFKHAHEVNYTFWITAYLVQMSGIFKRSKDSQLGPTWNIEHFRGLCNVNGHMEYQDKTKWVSIDQWKMKVRKKMGFLVHTCYRDLIAFLTPVVLMQSQGAMDFVQNCFAIGYITCLDIIRDGKVLVTRRK